MKTSRWYQTLTVQIVALLTLALLPLGSVAIYQTTRVASEAERTARLALLSLTERAARDEQLLIERAFGAVRFFGAIAPDLLEDVSRCEPVLSRFLELNEEYSFIGVLPSAQGPSCLAVRDSFDVDQIADLSDNLATQEAAITVNQRALRPGGTAFLVSEPFRVDGAPAGYVSIAAPHSVMRAHGDRMAERGLKELMTFNDSGDILTMRGDMETAKAELPMDRTLGVLSTQTSQSFVTTNRAGVQRRYTVVPIEGSPAAVIGVWGAEGLAGGQITNLLKPAIFPVLMWFASMGVAMLAIHTLVLRHLRRMRTNMNAFAQDRRIERRDDAVLMPTEFHDLQENFQRMTDDVMRDEALLEDALREKGVLVKEIHHRVKNNLQLISSIMNMQIRSAEHDETRKVLARIQDRVLSLATIHRDLYQSENGGRVDVGHLVAEVVEKSVEISAEDDQSVTVTTDIDRVLLYPDQAVPLSLLVAEAATNAMKYMGAETGDPWLRLTLKQVEGQCVLTMSNSLGAAVQRESSGMGSQLMNAFAIQLGAQIEADPAEGSYTLTVRFKPQEFAPEARDY